MMEKRINSILENITIDELLEFLNIDRLDVFQLMVDNGMFEVEELDCITPVDGAIT